MQQSRTKRRTGFLILVFLAFFTVGILLGKVIEQGDAGSIIASKTGQGKRVNVLLMGVDSREAGVFKSRTDTMILASIDKKTRKVVLLWIPRDTRVEVSPGHYNKINSLNYTQGPEGACAGVSKLVGTKINYYVITDFSGFARIVDILGGVDIEVENNMRHYDPDPHLSINLSKGKQHLNGEDALKYVRYRGGPTADIGRTARQQKFIQAMAEELFKTKTILKLPQLLPELSNSIDTNISMKDMISMGKAAREYDSQNIITQTLPGCPFTDRRTGASYWEADKEIANGIIEDLFAGKSYEVAQDPPEWIRQQPHLEVKEPEEQDLTGEGQDDPNFVGEEQDPADIKPDSGEVDDPTDQPDIEMPPTNQPDIEPLVPGDADEDSKSSALPGQGEKIEQLPAPPLTGQ